MKKTAVILAGGEGRRAGGGLPKQFRIVAGYPVLWWSIKKFVEEDPSTRIIVVVHPDYFDHWQGFLDTMPEAERICCEICSGG